MSHAFRWSCFDPDYPPVPSSVILFFCSASVSSKREILAHRKVLHCCISLCVTSKVRARFDGDEARLLSGEFPFRPIPVTTTTAAPDGRPSGRGIGGGVYRKDHGDPRTRCGVALDVTIQPVDPRSRGTDRKAGVGSESDRDLQQGVGSGGLVRLSCFVHNVVNLVAGVADKGNGEIAFKRLRTLEGLRVDALFKHDTRRALDLCAGSQLRMYDPSCVWQHVEEEEDGVPGVAAALLMCTQLCEPYPACLTPLPSSA